MVAGSSKLPGSGEMAGVQTGTTRREGPGIAPALSRCPVVTAGLGPSPLQYFVFDFHVSPDVMFDKIIKISVSGSNPVCH